MNEGLYYEEYLWQIGAEKKPIQKIKKVTHKEVKELFDSFDEEIGIGAITVEDVKKIKGEIK